jgi:hypothetical protein
MLPFCCRRTWKIDNELCFAREWRAQDSPRRVIKVEVLGRGRAGEAGAFSWAAVAAASTAALLAENPELS